MNYILAYHDNTLSDSGCLHALRCTISLLDGRIDDPANRIVLGASDDRRGMMLQIIPVKSSECRCLLDRWDWSFVDDPCVFCE
jgi:hypothetical protein